MGIDTNMSTYQISHLKPKRTGWNEHLMTNVVTANERGEFIAVEFTNWSHYKHWFMVWKCRKYRVLEIVGYDNQKFSDPSRKFGIRLADVLGGLQMTWSLAFWSLNPLISVNVGGANVNNKRVSFLVDVDYLGIGEDTRLGLDDWPQLGVVIVEANEYKFVITVHAPDLHFIQRHQSRETVIPCAEQSAAFDRRMVLHKPQSTLVICRGMVLGAKILGGIQLQRTALKKYCSTKRRVDVLIL